MHELAAVKSMIRIIEYECAKNSIMRAVMINVELGVLTTYRKDAVEYYFKIIADEKPLLKDAVLNIKIVNGVLECKDCAGRVEISDPHLLICPKCDSIDVHIIEGNDLRVLNIHGEKDV